MQNALVILCGGDSSRMGTDKALLPFGETCLLEYIVHKYEPFFDKIYLSVNLKGDYAHLNLNVTEIADMYMNAGPLGAIFSSLSMISEDRAFFISIDTPFMDPALGIHLINSSKNYDASALKLSDDYLDTVAYVISKSCLVSLGKCILKKNATYSYLLSRCYTNYISKDFIAEECSEPLSRQFFKMNDRRAYYLALSSILPDDILDIS